MAATGLENSELILRHRIDKKLRTLVNNAKHEVFENGIESEFSRNLAKIISSYGQIPLEVIEESWFTSGAVDTEIMMETLRFLGWSKDPATKDYRFKLLVKGLKHPSPLVRDSAGLGLEELGDLAAIPYLERAIQAEPFSSLREDFKRIIEQLRV